MYTSTFIFRPGDYDDAFHALDARIAAAARALPGYLGEQSWSDPASGQLCNVYYWRDEASLRALMTHPDHLAAKAAQAQWLRGYRVEIAQVLHHWGDGPLPHPASSPETDPA